MKKSIIILLLFSTIIFAQNTNYRISNILSTSPEEVTISINPTNPKNLIAGANLRFTYFSNDSGVTWTEKLLPPGTYGDPCLIFDVTGKAYYAHLADMTGRGGYWLDRMVVHRSSNGGTNWFDSIAIPVNSPKQQDKEWLTCDISNSPYRNTLYMAWTEFDTYGSTVSTDSSQILFSKLENGSNNWSVPIRISDEGGDCIDEDNTVEGAVPAVGPNGEVYVAWTGPKGIMFDRSLDGGKTFGKDIFVTSMPGGWDFSIQGISRCNGLPITVCDNSNSLYRGTIYILWSDQRNGFRNTDVFISKSTDKGSTWSPVIKVNTDVTNTHQFLPWIAIDQSNGNLHVVFYDRRNYSTKDSTTDVYLASSNDGSQTWSETKISQTPFVPRSNIFFGDYIGIAAHDGNVFPIWMRMDASNLSVWTTRIMVKPTYANNYDQISSQFSLSQNYPNPFNPSTKINFQIHDYGIVTLKVFDILGRDCTTLVETFLQPGDHSAMFYSDDLPSGVYYYQLKSGAFTETKRMVLIR